MEYFLLIFEMYKFQTSSIFIYSRNKSTGRLPFSFAWFYCSEFTSRNRIVDRYLTYLLNSFLNWKLLEFNLYFLLLLRVM